MKKRFYVFFAPAAVQPWWLRGLDKKISHCFAVEHQKIASYDMFLKIENLTNGVDTVVFFASLTDMMAAIRVQLSGIKYKSFEVDVDIDIRAPGHFWSVTNCVGLTKKLLGIKKPLILTPYSLYRYVKTIGKEI